MRKPIMAALTAAAFILNAPAANADPITADGDDSAGATCAVLGNELTGDTIGDAMVLSGVNSAIVTHYGLPWVTAERVVNYQVSTYCPRWWPNVVAVGATARAGAL
jgi:hypothetical protein